MTAPTVARGGLARSRRTGVTRVATMPAAFQHVDWILVAATVAISVLGVVMVYSATRGPDDQAPTTYFLQRQALFVLIGLGVMAAVAAFDYRKLRDWAIPIVGVALLLLFAVLTPMGSESKGTQAWFEFAGFQLQPSELGKLALVIGLAAFLTLEKHEINGRRLALILGFAAVPMALIMLQPDLGTVLVFGVTALGIVLVAGARPRHFAVILLLGIIGTVGILNSNVLADYQQERLTTFLDQGESRSAARNDAAYNQDQSEIAISAGQITGQGIGNGTQTGLDFVPEQHTDFIFTVVGEELGFVGGFTVIFLLGVIIWRMWRTAQLARDEFGMLLCVGVMAIFTFQVFENVGMTMGIMPVTGIPLPLMSYGGSSVITMFLAIGLVLNVHLHRFS
jgi:rod shape determining protein RodA